MTEPCPNHGCDLLNPRRLGRANYVCRKCGSDITLALVFFNDAIDDDRELRARARPHESATITKEERNND